MSPSWVSADVIALGIDQRVQDVDGIVLVAPDAAVENLLLAAFGVEVPTAAAILDDGDGERPVVGADVERYRAIRLQHHAMHLVITLHEVGPHVLVGDLISGMEDVAGAGTENRVSRMAVAGFRSVIQGQHRVAGRSEGLLVSLLRKTQGRAEHHRRQQGNRR